MNLTGTISALTEKGKMMAENYKHLYYEIKKLVELYQDEIVPGFRKAIRRLENNPAEVVRCKDCAHYHYDVRRRKNRCDHPLLDFDIECYDHWIDTEPDDFCSRGERRTGE